MQIHWTKINQIIDESTEVKTFLLDCPADFTWDEGAHTHFALKGFNEGDKPNRSLVRHMSISTLPNEKSIGITTRIKEKCSEFKEILKSYQAGKGVALFKTSTNVPLKREGKNIYLLSSGVGLATFRPLVLEYFQNVENVNQVHSLNIDSSREFLFTDIFKSAPDKNFSAEFVDNRKDYYDKVKNLAADEEGIYYIVGSDEFLVENIQLLRSQGIKPAQIILDKHERRIHEFLPA